MARVKKSEFLEKIRLPAWHAWPRFSDKELEMISAKFFIDKEFRRMLLKIKAAWVLHRISSKQVETWIRKMLKKPVKQVLREEKAKLKKKRRKTKKKVKKKRKKK